MNIFLQKIRFLLVLWLLGTVSYAQYNSGFWVGKRPFYKVEILMEDGSTKSGYLKDFTAPRFYEVGFSFKGIENNFHFDSTQFTFRTTKEGKSEILHQHDIKSITTFEEDGSNPMRFDKLKILDFNAKLDVVDNKKTAMLPLLRDGEMKVYGFFIDYVMQNNDFLSTVFISYVRKGNEPHAYVPFNVSFLNLLNIGKLDDKLRQAFILAGKCPQFTEYVNKNYQVNKEAREKVRNDVKAKDAAIAAMYKDVKNKEMRQALLRKIEHEYASKLYIELQQKHEELCR